MLNSMWHARASRAQDHVLYKAGKPKERDLYITHPQVCIASCSTETVVLWSHAWRPRAKASRVPRPKPSLRKDETYTLADRYRRSISACERGVCKSARIIFSSTHLAWAVPQHLTRSCWHKTCVTPSMIVRTGRASGGRSVQLKEPISPERKRQQALRNSSWHLVIRVPRSGPRKRNGL